MSLEFCEFLTTRFEELRVHRHAPSSSPARVEFPRPGRSHPSARWRHAVHSQILARPVQHAQPCSPARKPVVAALNGHAIAGGCALACAADRRLMSQEAGRIGVTVAAGWRSIPSHRTGNHAFGSRTGAFSDVLFSAATYPPAQAMERGLIDEIVDPGVLFERALASANALAALPPAAFAVTKRQVRQAALERAKLDPSQVEVEKIWTAPETLARIREYVTRTLRK